MGLPLLCWLISSFTFKCAVEAVLGGLADGGHISVPGEVNDGRRQRIELGISEADTDITAQTRGVALAIVSGIAKD